jgi:hypothetical protein
MDSPAMIVSFVKHHRNERVDALNPMTSLWTQDAISIEGSNHAQVIGVAKIHCLARIRMLWYAVSRPAQRSAPDLERMLEC